MIERKKVTQKTTQNNNQMSMKIFFPNTNKQNQTDIDRQINPKLDNYFNQTDKPKNSDDDDDYIGHWCDDVIVIEIHEWVY